MGWAAQRAAQIQEGLDNDAKRTAILLEKRAIVANHSYGLWDSLVSHLETDTKEFAASLPLAKEKNLQAVRLNANNLTIMTNAFPIIKFEILYSGRGVEGTLEETFSGLSETRTRKLRMIGFTVDHNLQPCFTDGERHLAPSQLAEQLMERVAEFFEKASRLPSFL